MLRKKQSSFVWTDKWLIFLSNYQELFKVVNCEQCNIVWEHQPSSPTETRGIHIMRLI
jgi:hypothetical protein